MSLKVRKLDIYWKIFVDIITIVWIFSFLMGLIIDFEDTSFLHNLSYLIYVFFLIDILFTLIRYKSINLFFKENWLDILTIIPIFRLIRFLRFFRIAKFRGLIKLILKSKKVKKGYGVFTDTIDIGNQVVNKVKIKKEVTD